MRREGGREMRKRKDRVDRGKVCGEVGKGGEEVVGVDLVGG